MLSGVRALAAETWREWNDDDAMQWGAALSYYAALSLAPLLVLLLSLLGILFDRALLRQQILDFAEQWVGPQGADLAETILVRDGGVLAGVSSAVLALLGATAVFGQLQKALNQLWQVRAGGGLRRLLVTRLLGFGMVLCFGALLLAALALQAVLAALPEWGGLPRVLNFLGSTAIFSLLFAGVYKVLPDADLRWRDVGVGAVVTALLFTTGQLLLGLYLGRSGVGSSYGAAGSLVAVLVWLYYSAQVFFFGAEFTQVWARRRGRRIRPTRGARLVESRTVAPAEGAPEEERDPSAGDAQADRGEAVARGEGGEGVEEGGPGTPPVPPSRTRVRGKASYP